MTCDMGSVPDSKRHTKTIFYKRLRFHSSSTKLSIPTKFIYLAREEFRLKPKDKTKNHFLYQTLSKQLGLKGNSLSVSTSKLIH